MKVPGHSDLIISLLGWSFNVSAPTRLSMVLNVYDPQAERSIPTFFLSEVISLVTK